MIRILQLSDPHLLADPHGRCRGHGALACLLHGWHQALRQLGQPPDLLLISGDLCQDESWGGYCRLREFLEQAVLPLGVAAALLPGNHDDPGLLRAALGRHAWIAPALVPVRHWGLVLLSSHRPGSVAGWLEPRQLLWLDQQLAAAATPLLLALHHPPLPIGAPALDGIGLQRPEPLLERLRASPRVRAVVFGHVHQHWRGELPRPGAGAALPLWACPSTLAAFEPVQPCPLGRADWPGGRLLELGPGGALSNRLLRWSPCSPA